MICDYRASVATVARIPYASQLLSNPDYLSNFADLAIWSIVECGIAITASSLATLRPLFIQMRFLAGGHFPTRYGHSRATSGGLPMQSANSVTVISSRGRSMRSKRSTGMTGSTAFSMSRYSRGTSQSGFLTSLKEGADPEKGIVVNTEFEMAIITKEPSLDSLDRFEAEVNEVICPGTIRRKSSYDQMHTSRRSTFDSRPSPRLPFNTQFHASSDATAPAATVQSPPSIPQDSSSSPSQNRRRPSEGPPPSFHLPTKLHHQSNVSVKSNHSGLIRFDSRNTFQGLSAPPRVPQVETGYTTYFPHSPDDTPLGSPIISLGDRASRRRSSASPSTPPQLPRPASGSRYPFPAPQTPIPEIPESARRGKPRTSAFMSGTGQGSGERYERGSHSPTWTRPSPELASVPSPLRSNPPGSPGPMGSWV